MLDSQSLNLQFTNRVWAMVLKPQAAAPDFREQLRGAQPEEATSPREETRAMKLGGGGRRPEESPVLLWGDDGKKAHSER